MPRYLHIPHTPDTARTLTLSGRNYLAVSGMRNYIVHEYFQIDDVVVWDVITNNLRPLRKQIEKYLTETNWAEWKQK